MKTEKKTRTARRIRKCLFSLTLMVCLCAVTLLFGGAAFRPMTVEAAAEPLRRIPVPPLPIVTIAPTPSIAPAPVETAPEPETEPIPAPEPILASVDLAPETQAAIYELCEGDQELFCAVMAIARAETRFTTDALGDHGNCVGMMQINRNFHVERMKKLGVTDLTDPVQCAAVAIDYILELSESFGWVDGHSLYLAYNAGPVGASRLNQIGVYSTWYTYEVLRYFNEYMEELAGAENAEGGI